jgi:hypothetical protein
MLTADDHCRAAPGGVLRVAGQAHICELSGKHDWLCRTPGRTTTSSRRLSRPATPEPQRRVPGLAELDEVIGGTGRQRFAMYYPYGALLTGVAGADDRAPAPRPLELEGGAYDRGASREGREDRYRGGHRSPAGRDQPGFLVSGRGIWQRPEGEDVRCPLRRPADRSLPRRQRCGLRAGGRVRPPPGAAEHGRGGRRGAALLLPRLVLPRRRPPQPDPLPAQGRPPAAARGTRLPGPRGLRPGIRLPRRPEAGRRRAAAPAAGVRLRPAQDHDVLPHRRLPLLVHAREPAGHEPPAGAGNRRMSSPSAPATRTRPCGWPRPRAARRRFPCGRPTCPRTPPSAPAMPTAC